jgi:hypothetical protein
MSAYSSTTLSASDPIARAAARSSRLVAGLLALPLLTLAGSAVWLWASHGGTVFFDMVLTGLRNCF